MRALWRVALAGCVASAGADPVRSKNYDYSADTLTAADRPAVVRESDRVWLGAPTDPDDKRLAACTVAERAHDPSATRCFETLVASLPPPEVDVAATLHLARYYAVLAPPERRDDARARALLARIGKLPPASDPCAPRAVVADGEQQQLDVRCGWAELDARHADAAIARFRAAAGGGDPALVRDAVGGWAVAAALADPVAVTSFLDTKDPAERVRRRHLVVDAKLALGDIDGAIAIVADVASAYPPGPARCRLAREVLAMHELQLDHRAAIETADAIIADLGRAPDPDCERGIAAQLGQLAPTWQNEAIKTRDATTGALASRAYRAFLALSPASPDAYDITFFLAELDFDRAKTPADWHAVADEYGRVVALNPHGKRSPEAAYATFLALKNARADDTALSDDDYARWAAAMKYVDLIRDDNHIGILFATATLYAHNHHTREAIPIVDKLRALAPENEVLGYAELVLTDQLIQAGAWRDAQRVASASHQPDLARIAPSLEAMVCDGERDRKAGAACFAKLATDHPSDPYAARARAIADELSR